MPTSQESQIEAMIAAAVQKAVEETTAKFTDLLDRSNEHNKRLLSEKKKLQGKPTPDEKPAPVKQGGPTITFDPDKHGAADYRRMKAQADAEGRDFQVLTRNPAQSAGGKLAAQFIDDTTNTLYVSRDFNNEMGPTRIRRAADAQGRKVIVFPNPDQFDERTRALHDAALSEGK